MGGTAYVRLLDADPELAQALAPPTYEGDGAREIVVPFFERDVGAWRAPRLTSAALGFLVLDGIVARELVLENVGTAELFGTGDVIRPWQAESAVPPLTLSSRWEILDRARLAVLDEEFVDTSLAAWPKLGSALVQRLVGQTRWAAVLAGLRVIRPLDARLMAILWTLAERWGRITPAGTSLTMLLTHRLIADLAGARRPSVSAALSRLQDDERVIRVAADSWLLRGNPRECLTTRRAAREAAAV